MKTESPSKPAPKAPAPPAPKASSKQGKSVGVKVPPRKKTPLRTRPAQPPIPLPKIIIKQLEKLSGRTVQVSWSEGWLRLLGALCGLVLVQGTLDWFFDLSWGIRLLFAIADVALLGWVVYRWFVQPVKNRLTPDQAALKAEIRWPALRTSLISAVQLARSPEGSPRMVEVLIQQVSKRAAQMDFSDAVSAKHLKKISLIVLLLAVVLVGAGALFGPKNSMVLLRRIILSREPLPTQTIVEPITGDFAIPAGETIEISARVKEGSSVFPRTGRVEISYEGRSTQTVPVSLKANTKDTFSVTLPNVQQALTYRFYLNDGRSPEFNVKILFGPVMESVSFEQEYPAYAGKEKIQRTAGDLSLLAGSKLHVKGKASQPLRAAFIQLKGVEQRIDMVIDGDKGVSADIPIPAKGMEGFSIVMTNTDGIQSQANTLYRVEVIPDKVPEITFDPGQPEESTLVESGHPTIAFKVADDFIIKQVFLCVEVPVEIKDESAPPPEAKVTKIPISIPATPSGALTFKYPWMTTTESGIWKVGTTINYWIEAVDNNNVTGPGVGVTAKRQWKIISDEEKKKEILDNLKKNADAVRDISDAQDKERTDVGNMIKKD